MVSSPFLLCIRRHSNHGGGGRDFPDSHLLRCSLASHTVAFSFSTSLLTRYIPISLFLTRRRFLFRIVLLFCFLYAMKHSRDGRGRLRRLSPCGRSHEAGARSDRAGQFFYGKVRRRRRKKEGRVGSFAPCPTAGRSGGGK